jgi:hypothetical protein
MNDMPPEFDELRVSLERVRAFLESLVVRGLRACGADELAQLRAFTNEFERAGASHVASALATLHARAEKGQREAARALLMAQTSVRLLERLLTLRVVRGEYELAAALADAGADAADEEEEDDQ